MKKKSLKSYKNRVWDELEYFDAFSILVIPCEHNAKVDFLVVFVSLLIPYLEFNRDVYIVEMLYYPSVLDDN